MRGLVAAAAIACVGCEAIDDFPHFHVGDTTAGDMGAAPDLVRRDSAPVCVGSLAGVGAGDFSVAFSVATASLDMPQPLLGQRAACDSAQGFWAAGMRANGAVTIEVGGDVLASNSPVNDGTLHGVRAWRSDGALYLAIDGRPDAGPLPSPVGLGDLPVIEIGKEAACGLVAFGVTITGVCLTVP